jgi:hypothetical protein
LVVQMANVVYIHVPRVGVARHTLPTPSECEQKWAAGPHKRLVKLEYLGPMPESKEARADNDVNVNTKAERIQPLP